MIVAFDPGKNIGVAVVEEGRLRRHEILTLEHLVSFAIPASATVIVGSGTGSKGVQRVLKARGVNYVVVDEWGSSLTARKLYWQANPPKGLRRLLPESMRAPQELIDDYAAYALALAFLARDN